MKKSFDGTSSLLIKEVGAEGEELQTNLQLCLVDVFGSEWPRQF